ncbi:hypothetical protein [Mesorhizobium sp. DCY119]|jgi:hypothetical protein|uniref:hypothetical protein n=1 Tax=Mesorhizobium sp. DCY119 TaxID=2108445 RepID=UPI000E6C5D8A|nr:hypothetical protein [Mesorhizobium sp. DCY119]RJG44594.1 hypothetical protein D3Y55_10160 [Mesorhizobium sp. DCY119]
MKTIIYALTATVVSFSAVSAHAGGWGSNTGNFSQSSGLINVSPSIGLGNIGLGVNLLNGSPILSGNNILSGNSTGILNGNSTGILTGILNGVGINLLGGNSSYKLKK